MSTVLEYFTAQLTFCKENTVFQQFFKIMLFELPLSHTTWGMFLEKKVFQIQSTWRSISIKVILLFTYWNKKLFSGRLSLFFTSIFEFKNWIFAIFERPQGVVIKKLFEYNLSVGKSLLILNWAELGITTVDTLTVVLQLSTGSCIVEHLS